MKKHLLSALVFAALAARSSAQSIDQDGDGHSDLWQARLGIPSANGDADSDGDGTSDSDEESAGTNPFDAASMPGLHGMETVRDAQGRERVRLKFDAVPGKTYQFFSSPDLDAGSWFDLGSAWTASAGGATHLEFPAPSGPRAFFRAQTGDVDADRDGLTASEEAIIGTLDSTSHSGGTGGPSDQQMAQNWLASNTLGFNPQGPQPNLAEVDVAFIRSVAAPAGGDTAWLVTATGTGQWHQLTSWRANTGQNPVEAATTPPVDGFSPVLQLLTPPLDATRPKFVSGRVRLNGSLVLSTRSLHSATAAFVHHQSTTWAPPAPLEASAHYALAHRFFSAGLGPARYQLVCAMATRNTETQVHAMRILTWNVNASTGAFTLLEDSGQLAVPILAAEPKLSVVHVTGEEFQLTYQESLENIVHLPFRVAAGGGVTLLGATINAVDIRGTNPACLSQHSNALLPLTSGGYLTANRFQSGSLGMKVWERRANPDDASKILPHLLTDESQDMLPATPGVFLSAPVVTDSFPGEEQAGEHTGSALATGDFNGDGYEDLAVGSPERNDGKGGVWILHGNSEGLKNEEFQQYWTQESAGIGGVAAPGEGFGAALAAGDFNGDGCDDLAIGVPRETTAQVANAGAVNIIYGSPFGLNADGNILLNAALIGSWPEGPDNFGASLAAGDFNGDGKDDLAVGAPGATITSQVRAGAVHIVRGGVSGLNIFGSLRWHQDATGVPGVAGEDDNFAASLTVADFNNDGAADLAIGIPGETVARLPHAGAVQILAGTAGGNPAIGAFISRDGFQNGDDIHGTPAAGDKFGFSLTAGDFNADGKPDLAIGAPFSDDPDGTVDAGAVHVLRGSAAGLVPTDNLMIEEKQFTPSGGILASSTLPEYHLGWSLTAGDCNGDGWDDLIAGLPGRMVNSRSNAGGFYLIAGRPAGLTSIGKKFLTEDSTQTEGEADFSMAGSSGEADRFGSTLVCGDFNADGEADVACGIPWQDNGDNLDCGAVQIIRGSEDYELALEKNVQWIPKRREVVRALLTSLTRENFGGIGTGRLWGTNEHIAPVHMASSTKTMTLLLAVEAIEAGKASLSDMVEVSELAGTTGGSKLDLRDANGAAIKDENGDPIPFIQPGDVMPLRLLLAGMMNESCNRCSVAIGEHIAECVTGDPRDFIIMMNNRAAQLAMDESTFGHPAGGWVTRPQDVVTLMREGVDHPLYVQFSSLMKYGDQPEEVLGGFDALNQPKVNGPFNQINHMGTYPGKYAWKGGNGGLWFSGEDADNVPAKPAGSWCSASLTATANRMDRILAAALQQSGSRDQDVLRMMDYGYRRIFTPDARGSREFPESGGIIAPGGNVAAKNMAADAWAGHGVTAIIDRHERLQINVWSLDAAASQINPESFVTKTYSLITGTPRQTPARVAMAKVPTGNSITDAFTVNRDEVSGRLTLQAWRIGEGQ